MATYQLASTLIMGVVDAPTDADNAARLQSGLVLSAAADMEVSAWWVRRAKKPAGGSATTLKLANAAWNATPDDYSTITLAAGADSCAPVTCSIPVAALGKAFIYPTAGGGHGDIEVALEYSATGSPDAATGGGTLYPSTVIAQARFECADAVEAYRCADEYFRDWMADAQHEIMSARPETRLTSAGARLAIPDTVGAGQPLSLGYRWKAALVDYLVAKYHGTLDVDMSDPGAAELRMARFYQAIGGKR
jgi:hypothetical protein